MYITYLFINIYMYTFTFLREDGFTSIYLSINSFAFFVML